MTGTTSVCVFAGGPLDGQDAGPGKGPYRHADGTAAALYYGDDRLLRGQWQAEDTGFYSLAHGVFRWVAAP